MEPLVSTIRERCRVCYTCVRECPAKAIRISSGQAEVIADRCIGCGNCVRVCSQKAKKVLSSIEPAKAVVSGPGLKAAMVAPSFPAQFSDLDHARLVGMIRALGFDLVVEVAFGADLVAAEYRKLVAEKDHAETSPDGRPVHRLIAANCPAIVEFIQRYHPDLVRNIAPVVSPMLAAARALHRLHGPQLKTVFIGPCIAKKAEQDPERGPEVDAALTFIELKSWLEEAGIDSDKVEPSEFDPPRGAQGALFPISRGMLQAADLDEDLMVGNVVAADGKSNFLEAIKEFETGYLDARLLEILCCSGCIMGPGIDSPLPLFSRRSLVSKYVRQKMAGFDHDEWRKWMDGLSDLDLSRTYRQNDQRLDAPGQDELEAILRRMGKYSPEDELNCGACGYDTCREHAVAILRGTAESEMCLPYSIDQLKKTIKELAVSNRQLADVQEALVQSEKLASMGQLAAGIAHEVNNPLGIVLMYAHLLLEDRGKDDPAIKEDLQMIVEQTDRCKKIVAGLLNFARQNRVVRQPVAIDALMERAIKSLPPPDGIRVVSNHPPAIGTADIDGDQVAQVLTNLLSNSYAAMPDGGQVKISASGDDDQVVFTVMDTGVGIPPENLSKVFEPFFTTKPLGRGTGLGLAVSYGIIKMHGGDIKVESNTSWEAGPTGTRFTFTLPRRGPER